MSNRQEISDWITRANSFAIDIDGVKVDLPLVTEMKYHEDSSTSLYVVNAPSVCVPHTGDIYSEGELLRYRGVNPRAAVSGVSWKSLTRPQRVKAIKAMAEGYVYKASEPLKVEPLKVEPLKAPEVSIPDFSEMTKKQLDVWATGEGIDLDGRASKSDMIAALEIELAKK